MKAIEDHWKEFGGRGVEVKVRRKSILNKRDEVEVSWSGSGGASVQKAETFACDLMDACNYAQFMKKGMADEREAS